MSDSGDRVTAVSGYGVLHRDTRLRHIDSLDDLNRPLAIDRLFYLGDTHLIVWRAGEHVASVMHHTRCRQSWDRFDRVDYSRPRPQWPPVLTEDIDNLTWV